MRKNDQYQVQIINISSDGNGVAFYNDIPIFIPYSAIGDEILVRIERVEKRYAYGRIVQIISSSKDRISPDCPLFGKCGGCSFRHLTYEAELRAKEQFVVDALKRIGKIDHPVNHIISSYHIDGYRNKAQFPVGNDEGGVYAGFFAPRSHRLLKFSEPCKLQPVIFDEIASFTCNLLTKHNVLPYSETNHSGLIRHLLIRQSSINGGILLTFILNGDSLPHQDQIIDELVSNFPTIQSININVNKIKGNTILTPNSRTIWGASFLNDEILGVPVEVSSLSFFQINHSATELLYSVVKKHVTGTNSKTVLDLYCGAGTIGLSVTSPNQELYGVEVIDDAINSAIQSAQLMKRSNAHFYCADASKIKDLVDQDVKFDLIITDPPRKGCSPDVLEQIIRSNCSKIVMVSCNAATLARDLQTLVENNYRIEDVQPVDMFPRTKHVEVVVLLSKESENLEQYTG